MKKRILSIDVLRGYDMFWITGGAGLVTAFAKALPSPVTDFLAVQVTHAEWGGFHHHDLIFALFLFLAGASWPFSLASRLARGVSKTRITLDVLRRFAVLFLLGAMLFGLLGFDFAHVRFNSILGRIGFGWAVAALGTLHFGRKGNWAFAAFCFFGYWAALQFLPLVFSPGLDPWGDGNFVDAFDRLLGIRAPDEYGTEGFFNALGCIAPAYLGVFAGQTLAREGDSGNMKTAKLFAWSVALLAGAGLAYLTGCRCVKPLWTPTYVLLCGSISFALLGALSWIVDVRGWTKWAFFFKVIGMNAITIYILQWAWSFPAFGRKVFGGVASLLPEAWGGVVLALGCILLRWLVLFFLYRHKIFLRV
jgi:predicted acyltransferase